MAIFTISEKEVAMRLDRWFRRFVYDIPQGHLEKMLRKGDLKVNDRKSSASYRLQLGDVVIIPEMTNHQAIKPKEKKKSMDVITDEDIEMIQSSVIHIDDQMIAINKPAGIAVQGGSKVSRSIDQLLDYLKFDALERPKLVHRLDKDTSGVLLLARDAASAAQLTHAFKNHHVEKEYLALITGRLPSKRGKVDLPLKKSQGNFEKMVVDPKGQAAITYYDSLGYNRAEDIEFIKLKPVTGRKHQLRAHMAHLDIPIIGDGKYGGKYAFSEKIPSKLHLHAYRITVKFDIGSAITIEAPLSGYFMESLKTLRMKL